MTTGFQTNPALYVPSAHLRCSLASPWSDRNQADREAAILHEQQFTIRYPCSRTRRQKSSAESSVRNLSENPPTVQTLIFSQAYNVPAQSHIRGSFHSTASHRSHPAGSSAILSMHQIVVIRDTDSGINFLFPSDQSHVLFPPAISEPETHMPLRIPSPRQYSRSRHHRPVPATIPTSSRIAIPSISPSAIVSPISIFASKNKRKLPFAYKVPRFRHSVLLFPGSASTTAIFRLRLCICW